MTMDLPAGTWYFGHVGIVIHVRNTILNRGSWPSTTYRRGESKARVAVPRNELAVHDKAGEGHVVHSPPDGTTALFVTLKSDY